MSTHGCTGIPCTICNAALKYGDVLSALSGYRQEDESADDAIVRLRSDVESRIAAAVAAEREACAKEAETFSAIARPMRLSLAAAIRARGGES